MDRFQYVIDRTAECVIAFCITAAIFVMMTELNTYLGEIGI